MLPAMKGYMFQSKTGALFFVVITLFGVASLVGTAEEDGALTSATSQIEQQGAQLRGQADKMANPDPDPEPNVVEAEEEDGAAFASDEELILDPVGIDPTPMEPNPEANDSQEVELDEAGGESGAEAAAE